MITESLFKPAWWLTNPHAQTLFSPLMRRLDSPINHTERLELPDGDFIDLAWATQNLSAETPLVVLLHGLGGSAHSSYVGGLLSAFNRFGWRGVLMHFRGASGEPNRLARAYHSGETKDLDFFLNTLIAREPHTKIALVGVSLGGNVLLKWLGEHSQQNLVKAAVAVSVPFQLGLAADRMNRGFSRIYQTVLLHHMREAFICKLDTHKDTLCLTAQDLASVHCFWTFDDRITAPIHGFSHVHEYYRTASSRQYLCKITTPTLILHSLDDPFMTPKVLPANNELSTNVTLELSKKGGHVGFIGGKSPMKPMYWLEQRIPEYLQSLL